MTTVKVVLRAADLSEVGLFSGLPGNALEAIVSCSQVRRYARGQMALEQGTRSGEVHVVVSGAFKACTLTEGGSAVTLALIGRREVFGEMAFLDGGEHSVNVTALATSYTQCIGTTALDAIVEAHPSVRNYLARLLTARLRRLSTVSERMVIEDVSARLARQLLDLSERFGTADSGGTRIMLDLPQQELAELVGATRERVNRVLMSWTKKGLIARQGRQIVVLSRPELSRCTGLTA